MLFNNFFTHYLFMHASIPAPPTSPPTTTHTHTPLSIPLHLSWIHPPAFVTYIKQNEAHNVGNENLEDDTWNEPSSVCLLYEFAHDKYLLQLPLNIQSVQTNFNVLMSSMKIFLMTNNTSRHSSHPPLTVLNRLVYTMQK